MGEPPKYLENAPGCQNCLSNEGPNGRFVPVEDSIPSIPRPQLEKHAEMYSSVEGNNLAIMVWGYTSQF